MKKTTDKSSIETLFGMFSGAAMNPRPYVRKKPLPATVTVVLGPQEMEMLQIIAARIGARPGWPLRSSTGCPIPIPNSRDLPTAP